jgi:uncharacterized protein (UPF0332 family)
MNLEADDLWHRALRALETARLDLPCDPDAAASRAYYSAFHAVSAWLALRGITLSRHSAVEAAVHRDLVKAGLWSPDLGADYSYLRELRMQGDYGGAIHVDAERARDAIGAAEGILTAVQALCPDLCPLTADPPAGEN